MKHKTLFLSLALAAALLCAGLVWDRAAPRIVPEQRAYPVGTSEIVGVWRCAPWHTLRSGEAFRLERRNGDGWAAVEGGPLFHDIAFSRRLGSRQTFPLASFGALDAGRYRVCVSAAQGGEALVVCGEFTLE